MKIGSGAGRFSPSAAGSRPLAVALPWALAFTLSAVAAQPARAVIEPGSVAPKLQLPDSKGGSVDLLTSGTVTLIVFAMTTDRDTSATLASIESMMVKIPRIANSVRRRIVAVRVKRDIHAQASQYANVGQKLRREGWRLLIDREDRAWNAYGIIASPTTVVVGRDGKIAATHPGYDSDLAADLRRALAEATGIELGDAITGNVVQPDLNITMGRRMAGRGLWDRAIPYYERVLEAGKLVEEDRLDMARIYLELERPEDARRIVETIGESAPLRAEARGLIEEWTKEHPGGPPAEHPSGALGDHPNKESSDAGESVASPLDD